MIGLPCFETPLTAGRVEGKCDGLPADDEKQSHLSLPRRNAANLRARQAEGETWAGGANQVWHSSQIAKTNILGLKKMRHISSIFTEYTRSTSMGDPRVTGLSPVNSQY